MFKFISKVADRVLYGFQIGCVAHCVFEYGGDFVVCNGPSMEPTLYTNNLLFTDRFTPRYRSVQRGDIIIAKSPTNPTTNICKRVVGVPGDKITLKPRFNFNPFSNSKSSLDEQKDLFDLNRFESNQELSQKNFIKSVIIVPRGHVWLEGDNFQNSSDSRTYGPVPLGLVVSRVVCRLWPIQDFRFFF